MLKMKIIFRYSILSLSLFVFYNLFGQNQSKIIEDSRDNLKKSIDFDNWLGKNDDLINGINLSKVNLVSLENAYELQHKNLFYVSRNKNDDSFVTYCSAWYKNEKNFVDISLSVLKSSLEAQEYLFDFYIFGSTLPIDIIKIQKIYPPWLEMSLSSKEYYLYVIIS